MRICAATELAKGLLRQARSTSVAEPTAEEQLKPRWISSSRDQILNLQSD